jgi:carboxymethylenebutenolidase
MEEELLLTPSQRKMVELWEKHTASEFDTKSIEDTMSTMTEEPYVNHVPVMTGGLGFDKVRKFYSEYFIPSQPPDTEIVLISRTVGTDRIVDELIHKFTHTTVMSWILPGVPPTGKRVEHGVVAIVHFKDGKIDSENIYWDQASILVQIGLLDPKTLPVAGRETARKLLDPSLPSNELMKRGVSS